MGRADSVQRGRMRSTPAIYVLCILGCVAVGGASAFVGGSTGVWYATLKKPSWTPPGAIFGPVWTALYTLMGVALAGVITKGGTAAGKRRAIGLFAAQLAANFAWSVLFFRLHSPGGAMLDIVALWLLIGLTIAAFWSVRDWTGVILLPYWAWVTFASALNAAIWRMNP